MSLIRTLHNQFLEEAEKSSVLLSDLANLEKYISESYSERSLIELIQNADDANATKFFITTLNEDVVFVANNGDYFTEEDVKSLCRSGSSTKKRKSNTIGYRGIGFKSVVNYTNQVHLVSGDVKLTFSKELTQHDLPNIENVPLIRIPHEFQGNKYEKQINEIISQGYKTIFIFETKFDSLMEEIDNFDETSLLFLRNLEVFTSKTDNFKEINSKRVKKENKNFISLKTGNEINTWLILTDTMDEENINIAFLLGDNLKVKELNNKAVIHSFMPTNTEFIIPCKINGDFSTDPSRTKIVIDEESISTIQSISEFFSKIILNCLNDEKDESRLLTVISSINMSKYGNQNTKTINDLFVDELINQLKSKLDNQKVLIQSDWLSESSFLELYGDSDNLLITDSLNNKIPGIKELLFKLGFEEASFDNAIDKATDNEFSEDTRVDLTAKAIEKTRFTTFKKDKDKINDAYLVDTGESIEKTKDTNKKISESFISKVEKKLDDTKDLEAFARKFDLDYDGLKQESVVEDYISNDDKPKVVKFGKKSNLTKWRSVEKNVTELIKSWVDIDDVEDVSLMNLGYDTKAIDDKGNELYFEIKSVNKLGDSIRITNNEYTHAHKYKDKYCLAIASQQEDFIEVVFIKNPIEALNLTKRVVKWEWVCDEYEGEYSKNYF